MIKIDVTCAIIKNDGAILACKRGAESEHPFEWEFPGGKIEPNETEEECIKREIREELGVEIRIVKELKFIEHYYPSMLVRLIPFICEITQGKPLALEHERFCWQPISQFSDLSWSEADKEVFAINYDDIVC